jgi:hypothetical protein
MSKWIKPASNVVNAGRDRQKPPKLSTDLLVVRLHSAVDPGTRSRSRSLEPVGVALEGDDLGVVDEPVDQGGGDVVAEDFAQPPNGLLEVAIRLTRS